MGKLMLADKDPNESRRVQEAETAPCLYYWASVSKDLKYW
jgi:hypothetical protein